MAGQEQRLSMTSPIVLTKENFYGMGTHKKCYQLPQFPNMCVKIPYNDGGVKDLEREIRYIHVMEHQHKKTALLPEYYGPVKTNYGTGQVFEMICNADGSPCHTMEEVLESPELLKQYFSLLVDALLKLKRELADKEIITMGLYPENVLFQQKEDGTYQIRLVNDMGCKTFIPLEYMFHFFARRRVVKRWQEFCETIMRKYPSQLAAELVRKIA